jgi:hypothetical protein
MDARIHPHTYIYIFTYIRIYLHTYIHKYIHTYIHTYINTDIHTYVIIVWKMLEDYMLLVNSVLCN